MKRAALVVASLFAVVACQDLTTTPDVAKDAGSPTFDGFFIDNPPPPPIDSGAVGETQDAETNTFIGEFHLNVTYMFNKPENSGWLKFKENQFDTSTDIDNSAAVRYSGGVFTGRGTIAVDLGTAILTIDLSKVSYDGSVFSDCGAPTDISTADTRSSCYSLAIGGGSLKYPDGKVSTANVRFSGEPIRSCITRGDGDECVITKPTS